MRNLTFKNDRIVTMYESVRMPAFEQQKKLNGPEFRKPNLSHEQLS